MVCVCVWGGGGGSKTWPNENLVNILKFFFKGLVMILAQNVYLYDF